MRTIRRALLFGLVFLLSPFCFSQESKAPSVEKNLYYRALAASLEKMDKEWGKYDDSNVHRVRTDYHNWILVTYPGITDGWPSQVGDYHVEYLDDRGVGERYKKLGREFPVLEVRPITNDPLIGWLHAGDTLEISFVVYWIEPEKGRGSYSWALSDWSEVYFHYDCGKGEFVIHGVKLGGV